MTLIFCNDWDMSPDAEIQFLNLYKTDGGKKEENKIT